MIDAIIERLKDDVPAFQGRVEKAADLARVMAREAPPTLTPVAWVLPAALTGATPQDAAGGYIQGVTEIIAVVTMLRVHDRTGERALDEIREIRDGIIQALAGWCPPDHPYELQLRQGRMTGFAAGEAVHEVTFSIADQLRIAR